MERARLCPLTMPELAQRGRLVREPREDPRAPTVPARSLARREGLRSSTKSAGCDGRSDGR
eukprot:5127491-Alexandrium_andersonii.AAC.1